jgi:hypothetical protein
LQVTRELLEVTSELMEVTRELLEVTRELLEVKLYLMFDFRRHLLPPINQNIVMAVVLWHASSDKLILRAVLFRFWN